MQHKALMHQAGKQMMVSSSRHNDAALVRAGSWAKHSSGPKALNVSNRYLFGGLVSY